MGIRGSVSRDSGIGAATSPTSSGGGSGTATTAGVFSVKDYGAKGDGVTNDAAAFQAAADAAKAARGSMYVPYSANHYIIATPIQVHSGEGMRIYGESDPAVNFAGSVIEFTGATGSLFEIFGTSSIEIDHLQMRWSNVAYAGDLLHIGWGNGAHADAQRFDVHHCGFNGASATVGSSCIRLEHAIIGSIHHCHIVGANNGIWMSQTDLVGNSSYIVGVQFHDNTYNSHGESHIKFDSQGIEDLRIYDEVFELCPTNGALWGTAGCQMYTFALEGCWFGDADSLVRTWINGLQMISGWHPGMLVGNEFNNPGAAGSKHLKLVGSWTLVGNSFELGTIFDSTNADTMNMVAIGNSFSTSVAIWSGARARDYTALGNVYPDTQGERNVATGSLRFKPQAGGAAIPAGLSDESLIVGAHVQALTALNPGSLYTYQLGGNPFATVLQSPGDHPTARETQLAAGNPPVAIVRTNGTPALGFFNVAPVAQAARAGQLTDSTGGTVSSTLAAGITDAVAKNAVASLTAKVNALETIIHNLGLSA